jgi:hypothetical protein
VVNHQVSGNLWVDAMRVDAQLGGGVTEGGKVNDGGHTGEVLQDYARRGEGDLALITRR